MMLYRLTDLPRSTWRLPHPLPVLPEQDSAAGTVQWGLRPALLDVQERTALRRVTRIITAYEGRVGQSRASLRADDQRLEELVGDYRLARCVARAVEESFYTFAAPTTPLGIAPAELRARVYTRAQECHGGFVPASARSTFLADLARELACTAQDIEETLLADAPSRAVLAPQPGRAGSSRDPAEVIRRYNAGAVATVLAASAVVVLRVPLHDVATLKEIYRRARGLRIGVDLSLPREERSAADRFVEVALYGPGSRALVRLREAATDDSTGDDEYDGDENPATLLPAAGGPALPVLLSGLARNGARLSGWARLLGPDRRLYHVPLEPAAMAALALRDDDVPDAEQAEGAPSYDSAVEAEFAAAFLAQQQEGPMGLTRGWTMLREPRPIITGATVFLPDFSFRRGDVEVLCEIIGYYTDDYLTRKRRKLETLRGKLTLLLVVDETFAAHFSGAGFPKITYRAGQDIRITDVVAALEKDFDPFTRRRASGVAALRTLCRQPGPPIDEEALCMLVNCGSRSELSDVWAELTATDDAGAEFARCYVVGQGLAPRGATDSARAQLTTRCTAGDGCCISLHEALALCREAGLPRPDDALLTALGLEVRRHGLFGEAVVCLPGADIYVGDQETAQPRKRKRR